MLQTEFEQCFGKAVTAETFDKYNTLYMESELDKDAFVALYKDIPEAAVDDLVRAFSIKNDFIAANEERENQLKERDERLARELMNEDDGLQRFAEQLTSKDYVLTVKLEGEFEINEAERTYLADLVRNK